MKKKTLLFVSLAVVGCSLLTIGVGILKQNNSKESIMLSKPTGSDISKAKILKDKDYSIRGNYIVVNGSFVGENGQEVEGKKTYKTIQSAIDAVPEGNTTPVIIFVKNGTYKEKITIKKPFISLIGENVINTKLTFDVASGTPLPNDPTKTYGTTGSASLTISGSDFSAENITFENSFDEANTGIVNRQAVAVKSNADKMYFRNCKFVGNQDTLYANLGRQYFRNCYIEGDVDFIFGGAQAMFDDCDIVSLDRGSSTNNGFISAASTKIDKKYGYLFYKCRLLSNIKTPATVALGRPWHPSGDVNAIASVVYKECYMGPHISSKGWEDMSGFKALDARFAEYGSTGEGAVKSSTSTRKVLTEQEASTYTMENVFEDWNPKEFIKTRYEKINIDSKQN